MNSYLQIPQSLQPPRVRFYVQVPGKEGGIGTKSHGHDSSIRIPNFTHIQVMGCALQKVTNNLNRNVFKATI